MRTIAYLAAIAGWVLAAAAPAPAAEAELDTRLAGEVIAQNVQLRGDAVTGTVVNRSPRAVREVRLQITYAWMWDDEMHPGDDAPGRTEYFTLAAEIPSGGSAPFTFRPGTPLPARSDGRFVPSVAVVGVTEIVPAGEP